MSERAETEVNCRLNSRDHLLPVPSNMANLNVNQTQGRSGPIKRNFELQDLLNFSESESSDEEPISSHNLLAKPESHMTKLDARATVACHLDKVNVPEESNSLKKVCREVEAGAVSGGKVTDANCGVRKSKTTQAKGHSVTETLHAEKEKRKLKKKVGRAAPKSKSVNNQNMTLADLGISFDFSESSDEEKPKTMAETVTESLCAEKEKKNMKKKAVRVTPKPKTKRSVDPQNKTLADIGISIDFSESSDEEKPKPAAEKQRITLTYQKKKKNLQVQQSDVEKCPDGNKQDSVQPKPVQISSPIKDGVKERDAGGPCKSSGQSSAAALSAATHDTNNVGKDVGTVETTSHRENAEKSCITVLNSKPLTQKHGGNVMSTLNPQVPFQKHAPLQHPNVSVIRSARRLSGSLLIDASPSEESLLPLSESTRLDCAESDEPARQNFGHLLAYHSSPKLFDSSLALGQSRDSSYEQLNIAKQKTAPSVTQTDDVKAQFGNGQKISFQEETQTWSLMGISENDSLYITCVATSDGSSMYEIVDVSVQTSFKTEAAGSCCVEKGLKALSLQQSAEGGCAESDHKGDKRRCEGSENGMMVQESEKEVETHHDKPSDSKLASLYPDSSDNGDLGIGGRNFENVDLVPDVDPKINVKAEIEQGKVASRPQLASSERAEESPMSLLVSPLHQQQRAKLPLDSNNFSESRNDVDNSLGCPDVHKSSKSPSEASHPTPAFSSKDGKKISILSKTEEPESDVEECLESGRDLRCTDSPDICSSASSKPRSQTEGNSASRFVPELNPVKFVTLLCSCKEKVLKVTVTDHSCFMLNQNLYCINAVPCSQAQ